MRRALLEGGPGRERVSLGSLTGVGSGADHPSTPAGYRVDHARSGFRAVLHCSRGRATGGREALPRSAAKQLAADLGARGFTTPACHHARKFSS